MSNLRQLSPEEVMFVGGETSKVYQHTAGLILLDASGRPDFGFEVYRRHLEERLAHVPQFRWKLHEVPMGLDLPYWVEDEDFSFAHHIKRIAVPSPGDNAALTELVSYLYSKHMDRNRPLWETWFIEGLADGQFAVLQKQHHCMMDGEGASRLFEAICDLAPDAPPRKVDSHIEGARAGEVPEPWRMSLNAAMHLYRLPIQASREVLDALRQNIRKRISSRGKSKDRPHAPMTIFNGDISADRGFVFGTLPLADIRTIKEHFGVTVNEVILALVGSGMRDYLQSLGELPDEALRTSIAVSLRTDQDDEFTNKVTVSSVTLATNIDDPFERLRVVAEETEQVKREAHAGGVKGVMEVVQLLPPVLVNAIMTFAPPEQVIEMAGVNLVVSSVRGSDQPMYMGGARMTAIYPMSIITPGGGINITCASYAGQVDIGITTEPDMVPNPWSIIDSLHKALAEYLSLVKRSKPGARNKKPAKARTRSKARANAGAKSKPKTGARPKYKAKPKAKAGTKARPRAKTKAKTPK